MNIWTPADAGPAAKLPVILYIHGGGFTGGCGHEKHFDGPVWPCHGVIAVTVNYRLGPLGFACLPELAAEAGHTGNYALFDLLTALQWVRANIAAFGGDADNITLMGQSAGGMAVQQLCLTPLAEGLFAKAVMSSGGGVSRLLGAKPAAEMPAVRSTGSAKMTPQADVLSPTFSERASMMACVCSFFVRIMSISCSSSRVIPTNCSALRFSVARARITVPPEAPALRAASIASSTFPERTTAMTRLYFLSSCFMILFSSCS